MQMVNVLQLRPCPFVQIENIDACLTFLAAKGINTQGLSAEGKLGSCMQLLLVAEGFDRSRPVLAASKQCYLSLPRTRTSAINHNGIIYNEKLGSKLSKSFERYLKCLQCQFVQMCVHFSPIMILAIMMMMISTVLPDTQRSGMVI